MAIWNPKTSLSALAITMIIGAPLITVLTPGVLKSPGNLSLINGEWAAAYEKAFDKNLAIRDTAIATWSIIQYGLFNEGRPGVLIGEDGWLYTSEDFEKHADYEQQIANNTNYVLAVSKILASKNIKLVIAEIPDKSRIYPEHLGHYVRPEFLESRYSAFLETLNSNGLVTVDLESPLSEGKSRQDVFLHTDTHWTPYGADVAAQAIAKTASPLLADIQKTEFTTAKGKTSEHSGDLLKYIPLGPLKAWGPPADTIDIAMTEANSPATDDLLGEASVPVALVGSSYSANVTWNFAGALEQAMGLTVANVAQEGKGPFVPMQDYLTSPAFIETPPALVIWEIPERFIPVKYDLESL
jgi:alginate O-acetyltransferase complex protein AlgJ